MSLCAEGGIWSIFNTQYRAGITVFALDPENSAVENAIMSAHALGKGGG